MPGPTQTDFFERADMLDTWVGQGKKDDPADVARVGYDAMMRGDGDVVSGWMNKLRSAIANVTPTAVLAEQHRRMRGRTDFAELVRAVGVTGDCESAECGPGLCET
jgi:short-subunit dehydrogenase